MITDGTEFIVFRLQKPVLDYTNRIIIKQTYTTLNLASFNKRSCILLWKKVSRQKSSKKDTLNRRYYQWLKSRQNKKETEFLSDTQHLAIHLFITLYLQHITYKTILTLILTCSSYIYTCKLTFILQNRQMLYKILDHSQAYNYLHYTKPKPYQCQYHYIDPKLVNIKH